jgi:hypothetical protein
MIKIEMSAFSRQKITLKMEAADYYNVSVLRVTTSVHIDISCCVTQGLQLDDKYVSQLKSMILIFNIMNVFKWTIIVVGGILAAIGLFLLVQKLTVAAAVALGRKSPEVSPRDIEAP